MSVSEHPVALRLEQRVGGATKLLATVMALPLVDGIFPALVIAGVLSTATGIVETGLLIFGGSATVAVILAEMEGSPREQAVSILLIGALIIPVAAAEAALAMTLDSLLNLEIFERFAGLVILAIATKTASSKVGEYLPSPAIIIALGLVASFSPDGASLQLTSDPVVVVQGMAAAAVGITFALAVALLGPHLRGKVDIDRFRFGSAVALGVLALPILGLLQTDAPIALAVLAVTALLAYNPDAGSIDAVDATESDDDDDDSTADDTAEDDIDETTTVDEPIVQHEDDVESELNVPTPDDAGGSAPTTVAENGGMTADGGDDSAFERSAADAEPADVPESETADVPESETAGPDGSETAGPDDSESVDLDERDSDADPEESGYGYPGEDEDRVPWL